MGKQAKQETHTLYPEDTDARERLRTRRLKLQAYDQYDRVFLLDASGVILADEPESFCKTPKVRKET